MFLLVLAKEVSEALPGDYLPPRGSLLLSNEGTVYKNSFL
jgi:hypothetical protein